MTRSPVPAALESRRRIVSPPMLMRGNMRMVGLLSATPSAGAGVAVQVPTQCDAMVIPHVQLKDEQKRSPEPSMKRTRSIAKGPCARRETEWALFERHGEFAQDASRIIFDRGSVRDQNAFQ